MEQGTTARQRVCPNCSSVSETPGDYCPHCGTAFERNKRAGQAGRRRTLLSVGLLALLLGGAAVALFATGTLPPRLSKAEYEDRMQSILEQATQESGSQLEQYDPSASVENAVRAGRSQSSTTARAADEFDELNPPPEVEEEHEALTEAYREAARVSNRLATDPEWGGSAIGQEKLYSTMDEAGAAESRVREQGYDIGPAYF